MSVWSFFDRVTSLTVDPSEWEKGQAEFARVGLTDVIKYQALAIDNDQILGVHQSFNGTTNLVLSEFYSSGAETLLSMEDDCWFRDLSHLESALQQLPNDWQILYLGGNLRDSSPERFAENLFRIHECWTTHAIAYRRNVIPYLLERQPGYSIEMFDTFLSRELSNLQAYIIAPMVCWQRPHYSGIWGRDVDYSDIFAASDSKLV